jgi:magnesium transporter
MSVPDARADESVTLRALLFDDNGEDREVQLDEAAGSVAEHQLLWIDVGRDVEELARIGKTIGLDVEMSRLAVASDRARVIEAEKYFRLCVTGVREGTPAPEPVMLDLVAARNVVISVHAAPVAGLQLLLEEIEGESRLGQLDAATFVALLLDGMLTGFFRAIEGIEEHIDDLDTRALATDDTDAIVARLVSLRREIAVLRRALNPQREVFAALVRPDLALQSEVGTPWAAVADRFHTAIESVDNARELLVGTFDIVMAHTGQRTNDVMRVLTVVSSILLPSVVIAGAMGMNFKTGLFDDPNNFYLVVAAMVLLAVGILVFARWRHWL